MGLDDYRGVIETGIRQVACEFIRSRGEGAFDLYCEAEIEAYLFGRLRASPLMSVRDQEGCRRYLVHLHSACTKRRFIDIVVWHPDEIDAYREHCWTRPSMAQTLRLLAAIQIKRGPGCITPLKHVKKDLDDLARVGNAEVNRRAQLYFIMLVDHGLRESRSSDTYRVAKGTLELWCNKDAKRRRGLLLSRDKVGFICPSDRWVVDALPAGVPASF